MNDSHPTMSPFPGVERLLASLTGVVSAHVVPGPEGTLREIHILASPELHPKQVVRNVESALSAGLGIQIDRRIVSVAQVRPDTVLADPPPAPPPTPAASPIAGTTEPRTHAYPVPGAASPARTPRSAPADLSRVVFRGYDVRLDAARRATCRVTLRSGPDDFSGEGHGPDTIRGRAEAAALATFAALAACRGPDRLGLEGVAVLDAHGRSFVLVAARALNGRRPVPLTGVAILDRSPEEAAIFASLHATNRWRASP